MMFGHQCIKRHLYCRSLCHQTYWPSLQEVSKFERDGNFVINLFCAKNVVSQPMSQDGDRILRFGGNELIEHSDGSPYPYWYDIFSDHVSEG